jgi:hypothetical protein
MDTTEVFPDPPPLAGLVIPSDVELALPGRSLTVSELFQYGVLPRVFVWLVGRYVAEPLSRRVAESPMS